MQLIDTHVHINFENFQTDLEVICSQWRQAGVVQLVHACGHPELSQQIQAQAMGDRRVVAIGETGLDSCKSDLSTNQITAFTSQISIARTLHLPIIIHCRDAAVAMQKIVKESWLAHGEVPGVMHCWAGTPEETQWFLDLGFHISFSGVVTFKNAKQIHAAAQMVPADRLLIETDCPFLAPVPHRGQRNEPAYVSHVAHHLAELRGVAVEEIAAITTTNAQRLFNLPQLT
jgi:TatD DNase family protein